MPGRRMHRRCYSILGALHEFGDCTGLDLCRILRFGSGTLYPALVHLENDGRITAYWVEQGVDRPRCRYYRIATPDERDDFRRRRDIEEIEPTPAPRRRLPWGAVWQPGAAQ